ncbi:protein kinase domain-containing protein [Neobacillus sp. D3-1R]|uniref:protein kinase domain-containing protein n=1 Tax=Neobacillus sp. D3-1R TaxID=3445778 RepID=UPI003FA0DAF3
MMNHSLKNQCKLDIGTVIKGKWHQNQYTIVKELGFGANGIVYLAKSKGQYVALKMSDNGMSITSEVNVLKSFAKVQGSTLGPSLLDVDDWVRRTGMVSFYVMEYIHGLNFLEFIEQKGKSWVPILVLQLLTDLERLHENGWVFGDLKPENLIVQGPPPKIRCIDVGGTTIQGRAIKEFTEFYDRGYWGLGSRKADYKYDLFAVGMIFINTAYPKRFNKTVGGVHQLSQMIKAKPELAKYENFILYALNGHFNSAKDMRKHLLNIVNDSPSSSSTKKTVQTQSTRMQKTQSIKNSSSRQVNKQNKKHHGFLETFLIIFIVTLLYIFYILGQLI